MHKAAKGKKLRSNSISIIYFTYILIINALFSCPPVWAEDDKNDKKSINIGDITVTATKMSTEVDKIPTNLNVISREEIEKYPGHYNALTLLREANIPGLYFPGNSGGSNADISVSSRGSEVSHWGMKVMINGIEFNRGNGYMRAGRLAVHDIERIEITKTPSAEYGDQAIGGVINIITRVATNPLEAKAGIAFTSLGGGNGYGVINGSHENWEYYLDASALREDSYQDDGYLDGENVYTMLRYALNDTADLAFHGSYKDSRGVYTAGLSREQFEDDPSQNPNTGADYYNETEESLGAFVYEQQLGRHKLMCKMELQSSNFQMYWNSYTDVEAWQAHPEVNISFNHDIAGMGNKLVIGGEYRFHEIKAKQYQASSFYDVGDIYQDFSREDISYAGYLQDELRITDALTINAGIRYDYFDLEQFANIKTSNAWAQEKGAFSPKIGITYQLCDEVNLFTGFNSGIKSPVRLGQWFTNGELDPEKLRAYEVGIRGNVFNWLDYNMAVFWQKVTDKFVRPSVDWSAEYENAGETSAKGVELGANARLPHGFYASTSFTYQKSEFDEFISGGVDYSGNHLTGVPDMMFAFQLGYRHDLLGDISLNPVYTGKRYFNYANTNEDEGFWVLNARYAKTIGRVELYIVGRNLFDESAVGSGSGNPGNENLYPMAGFNASIGLNMTF